MKYCLVCQQQLKNRDKFCVKCGAPQKKRRKKSLIIFLVVVVLSVAIMGAIFLHTKWREIENNEKQSVLVVEEFLKRYQQLDPSAGIYVDNGQIQFNGIQEMIAKNISYKVRDAEEFRDGYNVTAQISAPDFQSIFGKVVEEFEETDSEEDVINNLRLKLSSSDVPLKDFTVEIYVCNINDSYHIEMNAELLNALSGGYYEYIDLLVEEMLNG